MNQCLISRPNASAFELDEDLFTRNLRTSRKGAARGPSGMTTEHLRTILGSPPDTHLLFRAGDMSGPEPRSPTKLWTSSGLVDSPLRANQTVASEESSQET